MNKHQQDYPKEKHLFLHRVTNASLCSHLEGLLPMKHNWKKKQVDTCLTAIWIPSRRSSRLCKGKLMVLETRMDKESSCGIGMRLLAPRLNNRNLIFFGSPEPALASAKAAVGKSTLGRALQWDALAFLPHSTDTCWLQTITHTHTYTHI